MCVCHTYSCCRHLMAQGVASNQREASAAVAGTTAGRSCPSSSRVHS
jgi:hypothetical protein